MRRFITGSLFVFIFSCAAFAQEQSTNKYDEWNYEIRPYLWMAGQSGDISVRGLTVREFEISFSDIIQNLDMALSGYFEATNGRCTIFADLMYLNISQKPNLVEIRLKNAVGELGGMYSFHPNIEALAGVRVVRYKTELTPSGDRRTFSGSKTFVDPFAGLQVSGMLAERFTASARADIGGLAIGSDFSWNIVLAGDYRFSDWGSLYFAQRWWNIEYDPEDDPFLIDVLSAGPMLALAFHF